MKKPNSSDYIICKEDCEGIVYQELDVKSYVDSLEEYISYLEGGPVMCNIQGYTIVHCVGYSVSKMVLDTEYR